MHKLLLISICFILGSYPLQASTKTEKREAIPFSKVSLRVSANMFVEQGNEYSIEITAKQETLDKIIVEVEDRKLIVRFSLEDRFLNNFKPGEIDIKLTSKEIEYLSVQGSGNIFTSKIIESPSLDLNIAGSGDIKISKVKADHIDANISGSGDIVLSGKSVGKELDIDIAGSGDVIAYQYETESAFIRIAGSGDCEVNVNNYLDVKIFGSGDVSYKGEPSVKTSISGSGKVHQR